MWILFIKWNSSIIWLSLLIYAAPSDLLPEHCLQLINEHVLRLFNMSVKLTNSAFSKRITTFFLTFSYVAGIKIILKYFSDLFLYLNGVSKSVKLSLRIASLSRKLYGSMSTMMRSIVLLSIGSDIGRLSGHGGATFFSVISGKVNWDCLSSFFSAKNMSLIVLSSNCFSFVCPVFFMKFVFHLSVQSFSWYFVEWFLIFVVVGFLVRHYQYTEFHKIFCKFLYYCFYKNNPRCHYVPERWNKSFLNNYTNHSKNWKNSTCIHKWYWYNLLLIFIYLMTDKTYLDIFTLN